MDKVLFVKFLADQSNDSLLSMVDIWEMYSNEWFYIILELTHRWEAAYVSKNLPEMNRLVLVLSQNIKIGDGK